MGSSGSGRLSDYSGQKPTGPKQNNGGSSSADKCNTGVATTIEDISRCNYFKKFGLPPKDTEVHLMFNGVRLAIVENESGLEIGYMPTSYNYLKICLDNGFAYNGVVRLSSGTVNPYVLVDMVPA